MTVYSTSSAYAKDFWLPTLTNEFLNDEGSLLKKVGINWDAPVQFEGRKWYAKIQVGEELGFGVISSPGGDYATPGDASYAEATLNLMRFNGAIQVDGHEAGLLDSLDAGAAPKIMAQKMGGIKRRIMRELERMSIMDGTGQLAKVTSVSGTTFTFDQTGNEYAERNARTWIDDANRGRYRIVDPTDGTDQLSTPSSFTFSSLTDPLTTAVASATLTGAAAGDYLVTDYGQYGFSDSGHTTYTSPEFPGLLAAISTSGTYLGINRATAANYYWKSTVDSNSGTNRTFTETLAMQLLSKMAARSDDGGTIDGTNYFGLASFGVWNSYQSLMTPGIRYGISDNPDIGWGGKEYLLMHGVPLYKHIKAPRNQVLVVHRPSVHYATAKHANGGLFSFAENNGSIWYQTTAASGQGYADSRQAYITGWLGMYTDKPRNHGRLDDLTETAGSY